MTVLGLIKFTRNDESLFLLDEPDTHLNPVWKLDYFDQIERILNHKIQGSNKSAWDSSQVILTTHDPLMLTSLKADQVRVLTEDSEGKHSYIPDEDPINLGVEAIIQSELYGIRTSLDKEIQHKIDLRNRLLSSLKNGEDVTFEINKLNQELDEIGLSQAHPNPYFSNFAKAISRNPRFRRPNFTEKEFLDIQKLSDEMLNHVLSEGESDDVN
ncbi:hypothetical protein A9X69_04185 [Aeromonas hydrophila]|nr:hypothetical protein A9R12_11910 [Aeromonas hydrophila]OCY08327.1 hypothetical protein A9X70_10505 [Aeromonas hydrophila]OCY08537.1 hypothetical protein A9X69_04185 [Aeromonas hydrophila]